VPTLILAKLTSVQKGRNKVVFNTEGYNMPCVRTTVIVSKNL